MNVQVGAAGQVSVLVIPATAQIAAGSTFQYRTAVNGAGGNTAVKWAINGIPNGNATVGTISAGGIYTAPATVPNPNTIQVQATSLADTTATSTGTATLTNPAPVVTAVLPTTHPSGRLHPGGHRPKVCQRRGGVIRRHVPAHDICLLHRAHRNRHRDQRASRYGTKSR